MTTLLEHRLVAENSATASANKIHDDHVARQYGFRGGLVPGVDVYAYMTRPPAEAWGLDWLQSGTMQAKFVSPVYAGDEVVVVPGPEITTSTGTEVALEVRNGEGGLCAVGRAGLPAVPPEPLDLAVWADVSQSSDPPPASPAALRVGTPLGLEPHGFHADHADEYLAEVGETLPLYREESVAHPGWLLRDANYVLGQNVVLGPWIHVESIVQHHAIVRDGDVVTARATVTKEWTHKGHRFVELDVGLLELDGGLIARVTHTAIYEPRVSRA